MPITQKPVPAHYGLSAADVARVERWERLEVVLPKRVSIAVGVVGATVGAVEFGIAFGFFGMWIGLMLGVALLDFGRATCPAAAAVPRGRRALAAQPRRTPIKRRVADPRV